MFALHQDPPDVLTVKEIAYAMRVHYCTARSLVKNGDVKAYKVGHQWRVKKEALEDYLEKQQNGTAQTENA